MKICRTLALAAALLLTPAVSFAKPVLSAGELSVGAEFFPFNGLSTLRTGLDIGRVSTVPPHMGFNVRYAFSQMVAAYGNVGLFHRIQEGEDPSTFYSFGGGAEFNFISTNTTAALFKGGLQFLPRRDGSKQTLGVRFFAGPGVEARVSEALSFQIYSPLIDLQVGGQSTDFDFNLLPNLAMFVYF